MIVIGVGGSDCIARYGGVSPRNCSVNRLLALHMHMHIIVLGTIESRDC